MYLPFLNGKHLLIRSTLRDFASRRLIATDVMRREREGDINGTVEVFRELAKLGYTGIRIPEDYGGMGEDIYSWIILMEELGYFDPNIAGMMLIHTGAASQCIVHFASEDLKRKYLPLIARGERILAFAMTEDEIPGSWSSYMKTKAEIKGDKYLLNGRKTFITNAGVADIFIVFARLDPMEKGARGIGMFIVEKNFPGFHFDGEIPGLGTRALSWGTITLEDCEVPRENLIVGPPKAFSLAMDMFNTERIGNPSICNGIAQRAFDEALEFLIQRRDPRTGKSFLESYQGLQFKIAEMASLIRSSRLNVWYCAYLIQNEKPYVKEVQLAKLFANEMVRRVCIDSMQLQGGYGYSAELLTEKLVRGGMFGGIGGGTLEILKLRYISELMKEKGLKHHETSK
ncbi:MAG: acyl-CoA dehydrogenase family protein [Candidatus Methanomethylicia archaeon]